MSEHEHIRHGGGSGELVVHMQVNRSNATAGDSGANVAASAMISVLVTHDGVPVDDLGASAGNQTSAIALPAGWTLRDGFNVRPGGSIVTVTEFSNLGGGLYDIRIVPFVDNPASTWLTGEYVYGVQLEVTRTIGGRSFVLRGSALAKLAVL
ncbi:hypothetical protein [Kineosporia sp. A_224]|uniref:hypothetical protein n=1 Tax=Kineosporia sp. A_224 TaxID=1962180 RepID=UPI000B4A75EE|nr:hypothetical protein [Kineosporia sp. A_224]